MCAGPPPNKATMQSWAQSHLGARTTNCGSGAAGLVKGSSEAARSKSRTLVVHMFPSSAISGVGWPVGLKQVPLIGGLADQPFQILGEHLRDSGDIFT